MSPSKFLVAVGVSAGLVLSAVDALAQQPMPNRRDVIINEILPKCPAAFANAPVEDAHRRQVIPFIVAELNKRDNGNWGLLYKLDRQDETPEPGRLTVDIVVWKPTREVADVLSDKGGMWKAMPPFTDPDWLIREAGEFPTICGHIDPPKPPPAPTEILKVLEGLQSAVNMLLTEAENGVRAHDGLEARVVAQGQKLDEIRAEVSHAWEDITRMLASLQTQPEKPAIPCFVGSVLGRRVRLCPE